MRRPLLRPLGRASAAPAEHAPLAPCSWRRSVSRKQQSTPQPSGPPVTRLHCYPLAPVDRCGRCAREGCFSPPRLPASTGLDRAELSCIASHVATSRSNTVRAQSLRVPDSQRHAALTALSEGKGLEAGTRCPCSPRHPRASGSRSPGKGTVV